MKKAALHNLGCKVNAYETEAMQQLLEEAGYEIVPFTETADVYVINTCSVTNMADRKSRQMLHRAKKQNPDAIVVAAGCYVQTKTEEAAADEAIDLIIGNNQKSELVARIKALEKERGSAQAAADAPLKTVDVIDINRKGIGYEELNLHQTQEHTRAFIKIQDGCNQFCSYCIIPYARGRVRSRSIESIVKEVETLAAQGFKEVVLTGIHISSFGMDTGEKMLDLLSRVNAVDGIERFRLGSLEPRLITEEFTSELASMKKVCPHFHLSLQSGCDATLKRMNRKYTTAEYENGCNILRKYFDQPAITTDVIVGFPGETEEEFEETKAFLRRIRFYEMHIFKYSVRQGTAAARMKDQIPEPVKTERSNVLIEMEEQMSEEYRNEAVGKKKEALFEELQKISGKNCYVGYTREYIRVAVPAGEDLANQIRSGRICEKMDGEVYRMEI